MRLSKAIFIIGLAALITYGFKRITEPPKTYTVTLSLDEWRYVMQTIDTSSKLLNKSDLPVREVIFANQGLLSINSVIYNQLSAQTKAEIQKDSINSAKPKH